MSERYQTRSTIDSQYWTPASGNVIHLHNPDGGMVPALRVGDEVYPPSLWRHTPWVLKYIPSSHQIVDLTDGRRLEVLHVSAHHRDEFGEQDLVVWFEPGRAHVQWSSAYGWEQFVHEIGEDNISKINGKDKV